MAIKIYGLNGCLAALLLLFALPISIPPARADEVYTFVVKKQEEKATNRWSIKEWLDTRDRMRLMDLWLALHSPAPYEFFVGGAVTMADMSGAPSYTTSHLTAAAYASIFGLQFEREGGPSTRYDATFGLRFFGYHFQATHVRAELGLRSESAGGALSFQQALAGVGMSIYFSKFFGIDGRWRHAFSSTPNTAGIAFSGDRYEGGAFIDFSFLRVYGKYIYEKNNVEPTTLVSDSARSGPEAGILLFF